MKLLVLINITAVIMYCVIQKYILSPIPKMHERLGRSSPCTILHFSGALFCHFQHRTWQLFKLLLYFLSCWRTNIKIVPLINTNKYLQIFFKALLTLYSSLNLKCWDTIIGTKQRRMDWWLVDFEIVPKQQKGSEHARHFT